MAEREMRPRITVINDSAEFLDAAREVLAEDGPYRVTTRRADRTSAAEIREDDASLVVIDVVADDLRAVELARQLLAEDPLPLLVTTPVGVADDEIAELATSRQVRLLPKPFNGATLSAAIERMLRPSG
ncbi:MAG: hypothetical protein ACRDGV_10470 [Candidatus Limnocylindria bacterium]